ncbi:unnamed protein product [Adineta ricciae]|uniref:Uncharacterized protein n=1 Tax=Adineta ricciae TaxID=249248 RepID=A0A815W6F7_ADIRI|nr:unnamed protein product [Adineta ricciae]CAF1539725.1 unnamed protein product [Adineta ricciae]
MASNTTDNVLTLSRIIYSDGISDHLFQQYPKVLELLYWDLENTACALCATGAFELFQFTKTLRYAQSGTDNIKTWSDYKKGIHQYLKALNDDNRLEKAREILADHIHNEHFAKFPNWPSIFSRSQESNVFIDISSSYPVSNYWYVGWSCIGYIKVSDARSGFNSYYTDFEGKPELKILYCNETKMKEFETLANGDMEQAKDLIKKNKKQLTFRDLEDALSR